MDGRAYLEKLIADRLHPWRGSSVNRILADLDAALARTGQISPDTSSGTSRSRVSRSATVKERAPAVRRQPTSERRQESEVLPPELRRVIFWPVSGPTWGAKWVVQPLAEYGVPEVWWPWLGAAGLVAGLAVPWIGTVAGVGLVVYFLGAVVTVLRAKSYGHIAFPIIYVAPVLVALLV